MRGAGETGQCRLPAIIDDDRTERSVEAAAFWALLARAPGRVDRADEVETDIALRRQRDGDFTLTEFVFWFGRFAGHAATLAGKLMPRPEKGAVDSVVLGLSTSGKRRKDRGSCRSSIGSPSFMPR